jgi:heat shock protein HslJ
MTRSGRSALSVGWWSALGGFALCAVIVSGCGGEDSTPGASAGGTELVGTQWVLDVAALGVSGAGSVNSWISFARDSVSGNDGCNAFSGSYEVDGSKLRFGPLAGTKKACGAPADEVSREVTGALGRVRGYATSADTLRMKDAGGETVLSYVAATPGVEGGWTVISVLYGDAIRSVVVGTDLTADFAADGTLSGNTGCNSFRGDYTLEGKKLHVGPLTATKDACPTKEASEQEAGYLAALESAIRIEQAGPELTLLNSKGQMAVTLTR